MDLLTWIGRTFARFVGLLVALLGLWISGSKTFGTIVNGITDDSVWILVAVIAFGVPSLVGGVLFLFSFDGPARFRTRGWRGIAVVLMIIGSLLPHSLVLVVLPLSTLMLLSLIALPGMDEDEKLSTSV